MNLRLVKIWRKDVQSSPLFRFSSSVDCKEFGGVAVACWI